MLQHSAHASQHGPHTGILILFMWPWLLRSGIFLDIGFWAQHGRPLYRDFDFIHVAMATAVGDFSGPHTGILILFMWPWLLRSGIFLDIGFWDLASQQLYGQRYHFRSRRNTCAAVF